MRNSSFLEKQKNMLKRKNLWDSNSGIITLKRSTDICQSNRSTKPVDVVLAMSLHI